jgi:(E)-4-hydroxy-3-methylbut-2-enyl-diphosphate synthase
VGDIKLGSEHPIVRQTMTTSDTRDVAATVAEVIKCADAGAEMVRITVQGMQEAKACVEIKKTLLEKGYTTPLIADIHFAPKVAMTVAECFDKIRVNPGNFADGRKKFEDILYETDEEYEAEILEIEKVFTPLVLKCKERGVAMRIGVNHGSLSARTLSRFGDTPAGMVESAFEFARICRKHDYHNFVFSMKASNPLVMVQAYRLLAHEMYKIDWDYPLHLGVTEAGEGEDGRMKSAIGIGALLLDGLGDTIRVSLTEASHLEMEPCTRLRDLGMKACAENVGVEAFEEQGRDFKSFERRPCDLPSQKADDPIDMRNILHRDGSVLSAVTPAALATEDPFYRELGTKLAVGMPLRDIATSDSIFLREIPGKFLVSSFPNPGTHCFAGCPEYTVRPYIAQYTTDLTLSFPGISPNRRKGEPEPSPFTGDRVRRGGANRGARRDARSERGGAC